jgi:hypothetical protein
LSDFGPIAARLNLTSTNLKRFNDAIERVRTRHFTQKEEGKQVVEDLLSVLGPLVNNLSGRFSDSISLDESAMSEILQQKHNRNWQQFRDDLGELNKKLRSYQTNLTPNEIATLEDVADAMEAECAQLFNRISGRS